MKVRLYTIGCPRCEVLKEKLIKASVVFEIVDDVDVIKDMQFDNLPVLEVGGKFMEFKEALDWIREA